MHWVHNFAVSLMLFPLMLYSLVAWMMMIDYYEMRIILRDVARIVPRKGSIMRDKFDAMTFTQ